MLRKAKKKKIKNLVMESQKIKHDLWHCSFPHFIESHNNQRHISYLVLLHRNHTHHLLIFKIGFYRVKLAPFFSIRLSKEELGLVKSETHRNVNAIHCLEISCHRREFSAFCYICVKFVLPSCRNQSFRDGCGWNQ